MKYVKSLDGMRAIAILLVMMFHFFYMVEVGWVGVQLFFVLSGYLITTILLDVKTMPLKAYVKRFYWRRMVRIFPLYYLYIALVAGAFLVASIPENFPKLLPYLLAYAYNLMSLFEGYEPDLFFTHFWSLAIEEQFYLFWPFVIYFVSNKNLKWVLPGLVLLSLLCRYFLAQYLIDTSPYDMEQIGETVYRFTFSQVDSFAFGAMIPILKLGEKVKYPSRLMFFSTIVLVGLGTMNYLSLRDAGVEVGWTSLGMPIGGMSNYQHLWSYPLLAGFSVALILLVIGEPNTWMKKVMRSILESRLLVETGRISYGMYVYHWVLLVAYRKLIHPHVQAWNISFAVYFVVVFGVSWLSFNFFEKFFLKLKDKKFSAKGTVESGVGQGQ